jgi:hypothetical protein
VTSRRLLLLLAPLVLFLHQPAAATTAASLSGRIVIDGDLSDWAADEWVLDESTALVESGGDSHWGGDEEILRIGVTWDANFLYLAVEFRATSGSVLAGLGYAPGGLATLDGAGAFRRAIDFPFPLTVLARANARDVPLLARVDDRGVLALLDRATAPAAVQAPLEGASGFEVALPWSLLSFENPLQLTLALTGDEGTGAGDAAPNPSVDLPASHGPSSKARASLDRWLSIPADGNNDGAVDLGVSPRAVVAVRMDDDVTSNRDQDVSATLSVTPRAFAPDRGEGATFTVGVLNAGTVEELFVTARVYSLDGRLVRTLYQDAARDVGAGALVVSSDDRWDGRDDGGRVAAGGVYVIALEWGLVRGGHDGRATAGVAVAR